MYSTCKIIGLTYGEEYVITDPHKAVILQPTFITQNKNWYTIKFHDENVPTSGITGVTLSLSSSSANPYIVPCVIRSISCVKSGGTGSTFGTGTPPSLQLGSDEFVVGNFISVIGLLS